MLALPAALKKIADAEIELRNRVDVIRAEFVGLENGEELSVGREDGVRAQVCGDFRRFALLDRGACGFEIVIVLESHLNGFVERDTHRALRGSRRRLRSSYAGKTYRNRKNRPSQVLRTHMFLPHLE